MFVRLSQFARNYGLYLLGYGLATLLPILAIPVLTHHVSVEEYGVLALLLATANLLVPFASLCFQSAIRRLIVVDTPNSAAAHISSAFIMQLSVGLLIALLLILFGELISQWIQLDLVMLWWVLCYIVASLPHYMLMSILQAHKERGQYGMYFFGRSLGEIGVGLICIVFLDKGITWYIASYAMVNVVLAPILLLKINRLYALRLVFKKAPAKELLSFSLPSIPYNFSSQAIRFTDRFLIAMIIGVHATGIYGVAVQFASIMLLPTQVIMIVWEIWVFERLQERDYSIILKKLGLFALFIGLVAAMCALILPWLIPYLVSEEFYMATDVLPVMLLAYAVQSVYLLSTALLLYFKKTTWIFYGAVIMLVLNVTLNVVLLDTLGIMAAAWATVASYALGLVLVLFAVHRIRHQAELVPVTSL